jgi:hypothetical protein
MSLPLHPDTVSRMFMLAAMHRRSKTDHLESTETEIDGDDSATCDQPQDLSLNASQADRPERR